MSGIYYIVMDEKKDQDFMPALEFLKIRNWGQMWNEVNRRNAK